MKKIKKLLALVMAMTMVLGMAITVSAAVPSENDEGKITVQNVEEEEADVKAYRIVEPVYNEYGLTGYREVIEGTICLLYTSKDVMPMLVTERLFSEFTGSFLLSRCSA